MGGLLSHVSMHAGLPYDGKLGYLYLYNIQDFEVAASNETEAMVSFAGAGQRRGKEKKEEEEEEVWKGDGWEATTSSEPSTGADFFDNFLGGQKREAAAGNVFDRLSATHASHQRAPPPPVSAALFGGGGREDGKEREQAGWGDWEDQVRAHGVDQ